MEEEKNGLGVEGVGGGEGNTQKIVIARGGGVQFSHVIITIIDIIIIIIIIVIIIIIILDTPHFSDPLPLLQT